MPLTDEERFRFDLTGFLVRPAILKSEQVSAIVEQIERIHHDPESLSPEERDVPGGAASILIDHPRVIEVLHEIIGPDIRLENCNSIWRLAQLFHQSQVFCPRSYYCSPVLMLG